MGIKANFKIGDIQKEFDKAQKRVEDAMIKALKRLGEKCIQVARDSGDYIDQTGNLRSSIGYIIVVNGTIIERNFETANKDENGTGIATGSKFSETLAQKYSQGFVLIVVAGMSYAAAVESKSKDVLTSAEKYAEKELPKLLQRLKTNIDRSKR